MKFMDCLQDNNIEIYLMNCISLSYTKDQYGSATLLYQEGSLSKLIPKLIPKNLR
jgi:hypothetical protein